MLNAQEVVSCEEQSKANSNMTNFVDEEPEYNEGEIALENFSALNFAYPKEAIQNKVEGKCYVSFIVDKNGDISEVKIIKGIKNCQEFDVEAVRVIELTQCKWQMETS
jgi:periplasmic protein TonB